jgi:AcrR family transcriptional regulator
MARTRAALLEAAGECLSRYGIRKTTMVDVAARSRVAKATLYNHFRTKDDLLVAYLEDRVSTLSRTAVATATESGLSAGLQEISSALAADPVLRRAAVEEPALLAPLASPSDARGWQLARTGVADLLVAGRATATGADVDLVLRWVASQLLWPLDGAASVEVLARVLTPAAPEPSAVRSAPTQQHRPAVGWPSA